MKNIYTFGLTTTTLIAALYFSNAGRAYPQAHTNHIDKDPLISECGSVLIKIEEMSIEIKNTNDGIDSSFSIVMGCEIRDRNKKGSVTNPPILKRLRYDNDLELPKEALARINKYKEIKKYEEQFLLNFYLPRPPRDAKKIEILEAIVPMFYSHDTKTVFLDVRNKGQFIDAELLKLNLDNVEELKDGGVGVSIKSKQLKRIDGQPVDFYDWYLITASGGKFIPSGVGFKDDGFGVTFYEGPKKDVKGVLAEWYTIDEMVEIPFIFKNVPLP